ncbi:MAG: 50S ribosomal protein L10 [Monoglobus pectinilyticus]
MPSEKVLENKKAMVKQLTERLQNAQAGVLADYRGLTVEQDTELRRKLREANVEYTVLKNSIIRFAAKEVGLEDLDSVLEGPTAIATSNDDVISPAKVLCDFAKGNDLLEIKAGFVEGKVISIDEVKQYASIPSKEVLISKMMGSLQSPISKLARTWQAIVTEEAVPGGKAEETAAPAEEAPAAEAAETPAAE